jgi:hypothetical protein
MRHKYRAWDKENKKMIFYANIWNNSQPSKFCSIGPARFGNLLLPIELMQFTGLQDKNDKDIYEGDIVKSGKRDFEVVFESGSFMMCFANGASMMFINEMVEIIGNIYENPELVSNNSSE